MVDCSHGNSLKKHENQMKVVDSLQAQLSDGTEASWAIVGAMIESNLVEGEFDVATRCAAHAQLIDILSLPLQASKPSPTAAHRRSRTASR
jgi:phospho-2-dehydro-3-deoxyheptonate aldolase